MKGVRYFPVLPTFEYGGVLSSNEYHVITNLPRFFLILTSPPPPPPDFTHFLPSQFHPFFMSHTQPFPSHVTPCLGSQTHCPLESRVWNWGHAPFTHFLPSQFHPFFMSHTQLLPSHVTPCLGSQTHCPLESRVWN
ncbi:hypothetical protein AR158_C686L [Paramecium bursaria Chlorella virus AR158]|uniref:hypothetical protein n=1 Tax=Paramecium bursaria Chlorella virus AR158 TaxID=380598 RepID=UPI00015AA85B|nr:hypothetical protein AR158_C686L [Paramecium bursaria Chlorella virus AR158]ABU44231.1 hypothetical protein AR158_C686L [Paramecium bursaria Chlorella virus AR158]